MLTSQVEDTPDNRFRGVITVGATRVFADPETYDRPADAIEGVESTFAKALGKVITHTVAEDQQTLFDDKRKENGG